MEGFPLVLPGDSTEDVAKKQAQFDRDVLLTAVAVWIKERRDEGAITNVFPQALYLNTKVWEDEVARHLGQLCTDMKIQVLTSYNLPPETFHLTAKVYPVREIVLYIKEYGAMPSGKDM